MRTTVVFLTALALMLAACNSGSSSCSAIVDDGMEFFQDVIDDLDGKSLADLEGNPLAAEDYAQRANSLERRTVDAGCTDEEMAELLGARVSTLEAGDSNPTGQFFISILVAAVEEGGFDFGG